MTTRDASEIDFSTLKGDKEKEERLERGIDEARAEMEAVLEKSSQSREYARILLGALELASDENYDGLFNIYQSFATLELVTKGFLDEDAAAYEFFPIMRYGMLLPHVRSPEYEREFLQEYVGQDDGSLRNYLIDTTGIKFEDRLVALLRRRPRTGELVFSRAIEGMGSLEDFLGPCSPEVAEEVYGHIGSYYEEQGYVVSPVGPIPGDFNVTSPSGSLIVRSGLYDKEGLRLLDDETESELLVTVYPNRDQHFL